MPATPEHKGDMHLLARQRVREGRPVWADKIELKDLVPLGDDYSEDYDFVTFRDAIVARLRGSKWYARKATGDEEDSDFAYLIEELAETDTRDYFDTVMDAVYDEADYDRVWLNTF